MLSVTVSRGRPPVFPDACVVCGRLSPDSITRVKAAYCKRVAGVVSVIAGEWGVDVPACKRCGGKIDEQHRGRFLLALLCIVVGVVAGVVTVVWCDITGWYRKYVMVAVIAASLLPYYLYEWLDRRPVSLRVEGAEATLTFRDPHYAAEFRQLNEADRGDATD